MDLFTQNSSFHGIESYNMGSFVFETEWIFTLKLRDLYPASRTFPMRAMESERILHYLTRWADAFKAPERGSFIVDTSHGGHLTPSQYFTSKGAPLSVNTTQTAAPSAIVSSAFAALLPWSFWLRLEIKMRWNTKEEIPFALPTSQPGKESTMRSPA